MNDIDQDWLSTILGSTMVQLGKSVPFGNFGVIEICAAMQQADLEAETNGEPVRDSAAGSPAARQSAV